MSLFGYISHWNTQFCGNSALYKFCPGFLSLSTFTTCDISRAHWPDILHVDPTLLLFLADREIVYCWHCVLCTIQTLASIVGGPAKCSYVQALHGTTHKSFTITPGYTMIMRILSFYTPVTRVAFKIISKLSSRSELLTTEIEHVYIAFVVAHREYCTTPQTPIVGRGRKAPLLSPLGKFGSSTKVRSICRTIRRMSASR